METIKKIAEIDPSDLPLVERVFGQRLDPSVGAVLILRVPETNGVAGPQPESDEVPAWCNVLEGMSDQDLADFDATLAIPVWLAHRNG
jgi:hypothetical protein